MNYVVPITEDWVVGELVNEECSVGLHNLSTPEIELVGSVILSEDGSVDSSLASKWSIVDAALCLADDRGKTVFRLNGAQSRNGSVYLSGESLRDAHMDGFTTAVMYPFIPVGDNFGVMISSHSDYYENGPVDVLLKSLLRQGISEDRITVVVGGSQEENDEESPQYVHTPDNHFGFGGFLAMDDSYHYDITFFTPEEHNGIGLYRTGFINNIDWASVRGDRITGHLKKMASLTTLLGGRNNEGMSLRGSRDVYGNGTVRNVFNLGDTGIKKYSSQSLTVKVP
jgi:hypothetical protein